MGGLQWVLELVLVGLLGGTLFHALRLERALGVIKRDRAELEALLHGFNESTARAESGVSQLRGAVDGAGRQIARQIEAAAALKDDLTTLIERGEAIADRIDGQIRADRLVAPPRRAPVPPPPPPPPMPELAEPEGPRVRSQAERDLLRALRVTR